MIIIPVDHGNSAMKTDKHVFTSGLKEYPDKPPMATEVLQFDNKFWVLTETRIPVMLDKTESEHFFILTLFAIAKNLITMGLTQQDQEVILAAGLPPEHFIKQREGFAKYLKRDDLSFTYNKQEFKIHIKEVWVYPQAYAAVVPKASELMQTPQCYIIDIGGFTTDVLLLKASRPDLEVCRSLEYGVIDMCNTIIGAVNTKYGIALMYDQIVAIVQGKENKVLTDDVVKLIRTEAERYADTILNSLREHKIELRANPAYFIGGGAILFKKYIEQSPLVASPEFITDQKANAIGYGILANAQQNRPTI